jgi:hypothetical protein
MLSFAAIDDATHRVNIHTQLGASAIQHAARMGSQAALVKLVLLQPFSAVDATLVLQIQ